MTSFTIKFDYRYPGHIFFVHATLPPAFWVHWSHQTAISISMHREKLIDPYHFWIILSASLSNLSTTLLYLTLFSCFTAQISSTLLILSILNLLAIFTFFSTPVWSYPVRLLIEISMLSIGQFLFSNLISLLILFLCSFMTHLHSFFAIYLLIFKICQVSEKVLITISQASNFLLSIVRFYSELYQIYIFLDFYLF